MSHAYNRLTIHIAHYGFIVTSRDEGRKLACNVLPYRDSTLRLESKPRKVTMNHIMGRDTDGNGICSEDCLRLVLDRILLVPFPGNPYPVVVS